MDPASMPPYGPARAEKEVRLLAELNALTRHHYEGCPDYHRLMEGLHGGCPSALRLEAVPFLPVRLFKHRDLLSVPREEVVKVMTSSGTGGQAVSRIHLDKATAALQIKVLSSLMVDLIGKQRLPMLVLDAAGTVSDRRRFSARAAGILGFSMFGRDVTYALDDRMDLDLGAIEAFLDRHAGEDILLFGFTAILWEHLVRSLEDSGRKLAIPRGLLLHGGGWKKLQAQAVSNAEFKARLAEATGIRRVHNYYGMVEQTGSIFLECEAGRLHASAFSEVLIRDSVDFSLRAPGEPGLLQLLSVIPRSYPGHSLLSEDLGEILGVDDCPCGREGTTFRVHGRIKDAEVRGCSDTYAR